jgi:selenide,water dikinase
MVTRPLGNAVLASAVYAKYKEPERYEQLLYQWGSKLEELAAKVIRRFHLPPAICIGNRGLIGQILDQIGETDIRIEIELEKIPFLPEVVNVAEMGLIPAETFVKKEIYESRIEISRAQNLLKVDLLFVSQSSGELLLVIPPEKENAILKLFEEEKQLARVIGRVYPAEGKKGILTIV